MNAYNRNLWAAFQISTLQPLKPIYTSTATMRALRHCPDNNFLEFLCIVDLAWQSVR
mgnify:CR=1 FL=1